MPMRATTVRFDEGLWGLLEREARTQGVSAAQFIRDAAVMRIAHAMGTRGEPLYEREHVEHVQEAVRDPGRVAALRATGLLETGADPQFDRLTGLAARVLGAPVALVSLVDADRQVFKSCLGLPEPWQSERQTPLSHSFCQHAVARREPLIIEDAREDPVLKDNLAIRDLNVIAYAGIPLIDDDGHALGSLCVIDDKPRHWTPDQVQLLSDLAQAVQTEIRLARAA
jgi:GAF domain-containing protein